MADPSTTRPNAPTSATPLPARAQGGTSGPSVGSTASAATTSDDVDELGTTVAGDFAAPAATRTPVPRAEVSVISRVISVGTPTKLDEEAAIAAMSDPASFTNDSDGTSSVNSAAKMHAQTLSGLAPPPELQSAETFAQLRAAAKAAKASPPSAASKLQLPPTRPGPHPPGKPGSTPPAGSAVPRPGSGPAYGPPPRPGASQPPRMGFQPPPLPPAVSVPGLRPSTPSTPAPAPAGFVAQNPNVKRVSGAMAAVTPPLPPSDPRRSTQGMPAMAPPPMPSDLRRSAQGMPAMAPPPMPGDPRRASQSMQAVTPPPTPVDPRRASQSMQAVTPPPTPVDPRRASQSMQAVTPPPTPVDPRRTSQAMQAVTPPTDPRRSSSGMLAVSAPDPDADLIPEAFAAVSLTTGGTIPMINKAQGSSPGPAANHERSDGAFGESKPPKIIYAPGSVIAGKYRLERVLGQGGMGAVWVVRNISLDADFALKLIRRDRATEEAAARLLTEARAAAKLGHPGIVRVFDFGQSEVGDPYLVMELLKGDSFGQLIARKKRLEPAVAVQMLLPVASALYAAHSKGIVHRDLKPDNIMLSTEDLSRKLVPKVLDFGIARVLRDDIDRHQTMAGEVLGSPDYMSPEQARGQLDIDHRTDIWTFAVLLYESITGKRPFEGHNYNALIASIVSNAPMPIHAYGIADTELSGIIDRGLSKSPTARWQTMRDMGIALATWAVEHGIHQDISGVSIQTEWLASQSPNLKTLQPAQLPRLAVPGAERQVAQSTAPVAAEWQGLRNDGRRKWIIGIAVVAVFVATFIIMSKTTTIFSGSSNPASNVDAGTTPAPSASALRVQPTTTTSPTTAIEPAAQPSARTSASAAIALPSTRPTTSTKRKGPPVPTNIKF